MDAVRQKLADAFGDGATPNIINMLIQVLQMLLSGGICPTPAAKLAWAKKHPWLTGRKVEYYMGEITDDPDVAQRAAAAIDKVLPTATDAEAAAIYTPPSV